MSKEILNQQLDAFEQRFIERASLEPDAEKRAQLYAGLTQYAQARAQLVHTLQLLHERVPEPAPPTAKPAVVERKPAPLQERPLKVAFLHPKGTRVVEFRGDTEKALVSRLLEASPEPVSRFTLGAAVYGEEEAKHLDKRGKLRNRITAAVSHIRREIEPDPSSPQFLETVKGKGYRLLATIEEPEERFYTIPKAAELVNFSSRRVHEYISEGLLEEGVHFLETGGTQRTQRRINEAGIEMLKQIEQVRGGKKTPLSTIRERLAARRRPEEPEEKTPSRTEQVREILFSRPGRVTPAAVIAGELETTRTAVYEAVRRLRKRVGGDRIVGTQFGYFVRPEAEHLQPEKIGFSEEETLKLAHRLSDAAERLKEVYGVKIADTVHQMWAQFRDGGGVLENPEAAVRSLEQKLFSLAQDPAAALPNFSGNYPVEEVLMLMYPLDSVRRGQFLKQLLYPKNHTFVARWGEPVERVRKDK